MRDLNRVAGAGPGDDLADAGGVSIMAGHCQKNIESFAGDDSAAGVVSPLIPVERVLGGAAAKVEANELGVGVAERTGNKPVEGDGADSSGFRQLFSSG